MNGFRVLLRSNQFILLLLLLLQLQSLGLDIDSRPATEVCATHTLSPGPKDFFKGFIQFFLKDLCHIHKGCFKERVVALCCLAGSCFEILIGVTLEFPGVKGELGDMGAQGNIGKSGPIGKK
ncbi:hypothetical protein STEG23_033178, partial [Scotinomys teguina]